MGIGSSHTEISEDEASDFDNEVAPEPVKVKAEKKAKSPKEEEPEDKLMVESESGMEEDDDEVGEDEYVDGQGDIDLD